jgi:hypothetical protein
MPASPPPDPVETIRQILLSEDQRKFRALERDFAAFRDRAGESDTRLASDIEALLAKLRTLRDLIGEGQQRSTQIEAAITLLQARVAQESETLFQRISPELTSLMRETIRNSPDEMAEAIGPVMGEAIRVQIRDSRHQMVDALYPIIGETVQRAVAAFALEFQRNIDARLRSFRSRNVFTRLAARLRGVSDAELAFRDALPFAIKETFLIQHGSGLLIARHSPHTAAADSDLVSAMLTAIRDFVRDSFSGGETAQAELDEIMYGDHRILVQSGAHAYLAVVYQGVEPEGFRAAIRTFVTELHVQFSADLKHYSGDPASLPEILPRLAEVPDSFREERAPLGFTRPQKMVLWIGGVGLILALALACFYLQFTLALLPAAFPADTLTPTQTPTASLSPSATPSLTPTLTPTPTPTPTFTPSPSPTAVPSATATVSPSPTDSPLLAVMLGDVWLHSEPNAFTRTNNSVVTGTQVELLAVNGAWALIRVDAGRTTLEGWVPLRWVAPYEPIPAHLVTPSP